MASIVVVRNAAADAIAAVYGVNWPWRQVFITSRFDGRIWQPHLRAVMPHLDAAVAIPHLRGMIYGELDQLPARNLHEVRLPADQAESLAFSEAGGTR